MSLSSQRTLDRGSVARHVTVAATSHNPAPVDLITHRGGQVQKMFSNISIFKTKSSLARVASVEVTQIPRVRSPTEPTSFCSSYGSAQSTIWFLLRRRRVGLFRANSSPPRSGCGCSEGFCRTHCSVAMLLKLPCCSMLQAADSGSSDDARRWKRLRPTPHPAVPRVKGSRVRSSRILKASSSSDECKVSRRPKCNAIELLPRPPLRP